MPDGNGEEVVLDLLLCSLLYSGYLAMYTAELLRFFLTLHKLFNDRGGQGGDRSLARCGSFKVKSETSNVKN